MNTQWLKLVLIGSVGLALLTACAFNITDPSALTRVTGSGKVVTVSRDVSGFNGLVVNGAGKVSVEWTGTEALSITADDNLLPYIVVQVRDSNLVIEFKPNVVFDRTTDLTFKVAVKNLNSIELNGAVALEGQGIDADRLSVRVNGAGAARMQGKIAQQEISLTGTGAYNAENVEGKGATVTNSGAGAAVVRVSDQLNATINGIGVIEYIGNPQVTKNVAGIGVIRQR